ncbi:MAG: S8/S53 family peptidase [Nocardiopsaceae bacterium]|nr:S8/S53 family peptidase [Nocardiopsaceae bacterium]
MPELVPLPGSERAELPGAQPSGTLDSNAEITVTVLLRRRAEIPEELITGPQTIVHDELGQSYGASSEDVELVTSALGGHGLRVTQAHPESRRLKVSGTVSQMSAAFGTTLSQVTSPHPDGSGPVTHRYRTGGLSVPAELDGIVTAVLGLDDRPVARAHFRVAQRSSVGSESTMGTDTASPDRRKWWQRLTEPKRESAPAAGQPTSMTALQVAELYKFPANTDGTGQTIAIVELGGGYTTSDLNTYFSGLNLTPPSVTAVGVDGGSNSPGGQADGEVELDIEVAGAVAPKAAQKVYFAPNTDQGFIDAVSDAIHASPTPTVVSISWGGPEDSWAAASRTSLDSAIADGAALGVTVCVAAGDNGSTDGQSDGKEHCDFPASSPHALACGGTTLVGSGTAITSEVVWNELAKKEGATGGGVSDVFPLPSWQANAGVPKISGGSKTGRGVPDVAGNADPVSGYQVVVDGQQTVVGGTSAVAPLWAGLIARLAQSTGKKFGLLQTPLYNGVTAGQAAPGFNDVTSGNNGAYKAGPGWDACTGLGSPNGTELLTRLKT